MGRVLVVEDDDRIARLIGRALRGDGFTAIQVASGSVAHQTTVALSVT